MKAYILLDRSASMSTKWDETLGSINDYVDELAKAKIKTKTEVTLATFDYQGDMKFEVIRESVEPKNWQRVTSVDATPRGWTPLFDAIGSLVNLVEKDKPKRAVIAIMTDGEENTSKEVSREAAKAALDRCRNKNLQVVFLGVDFDSFGQAASLGTGAGQTITTSAGNYGSTMRGLAGMSVSYCSTGAAMDFSDDLRQTAVSGDSITWSQPTTDLNTNTKKAKKKA